MLNISFCQALDYCSWTATERERFAMVYETLLSRMVARTRDVDLAQRLLQRNPYEKLSYETLIEAELASGASRRRFVTATARDCRICGARRSRVPSVRTVTLPLRIKNSSNCTACS